MSCLKDKEKEVVKGLLTPCGLYNDLLTCLYDNVHLKAARTRFYKQSLRCVYSTGLADIDSVKEVVLEVCHRGVTGCLSVA